MEDQRILPPRLTPGDAISLVAPASTAKPTDIQAAIASLKDADYVVKQYRDLGQTERYLCGSDAVRADELNEAFSDEETTAVLAVRGGYGVSRLLDAIDYDAICERPKVFVGYSDMTALHVAIDQRVGMVTYHGPNAIDGLRGNGRLDSESIESYWQAVTETPTSGIPLFGGSIRQFESLAGGVGEGRLIGGNLAVFAGLLGTPFQPDTAGRVLFLEDIDEAPHRIDRMLCQMRLAGMLSQVTAVLLGDFSDCDDDRSAAREVLLDYFGGLGVPVLAGCPFGHAMPNHTLPHGALVRVDATSNAVELLE
ncbi:MAG: LD-carboxypeptidase [Planctomycetota bacterium]